MTYDAIVIGAGPAGSMAALLLARAGWRVAIIEKHAFPRRKVCGEFISAPALELLARAGLAREVMHDAGPEIREIGVYAGERGAVAEMPPHEGAFAHGRSLGREHLDARLLRAAERAGARVLQPWKVQSYERSRERFTLVVRHEIATPSRARNDTKGMSLRGARRRSNRDEIDRRGKLASVIVRHPGQDHSRASLIATPSRADTKRARDEIDLRGKLVIAAHGSWDTGGLEIPGDPSDVIAFKAHLRDCDLPPHELPIITFPGGYAGLVTTDDVRASFACCIRREALAQCRAQSPGASAASAVLAHVLRSSPHARKAIGRATCEGAWLATGPLRPGIHARCGGGAFTIGNAHGETHPIVGEGINMALQSAFLLSTRLIALGRDAAMSELDALAREYERAYEALFARRIAAASAFAALAMRPASARTMAYLFHKLPPVFAFCARRAGKTAPFPLDQEALQTAPVSR